MTKTFHDALVAELNERHIDAPLKWFNSSHSNDACGSAMYEIDLLSRTSSFMRSRRQKTSWGRGAGSTASASRSWATSTTPLMKATTVTSASRKPAAADRFFEKHHRVTRLYVPITEYEHTDMVDDMIGGVYKHVEVIDYDTPIPNWHILVVSDGNEEAYGAKYHLFLPQEDHISNDLAERRC